MHEVASLKKFTAEIAAPYTSESVELNYSRDIIVVIQIITHWQFTRFNFGRWTKVKGGEIVRSPALTFRNGYYIKVTDKF